jgi:NitT/TauT family transport system substrate-binding protein
VKKIFIAIVGLIVISLITTFLILDSKKSDLVKVRLAEVTHSIFYAPQYVAIEKGYFEEEGIDIELILTPGADKVMAAVLSNDVDIGFSGSEATIYVYNGGEKDYVQTFAQLTQRDGSFLVSRTKIDNFKVSDLKGKYIIGGRKGGMPEMTLEWILKEHGLDIKKELTIDTSVAFPAMSGAFIGGLGDFVSLFEPNALMVEKQGFGYVVASIGELGGKVPYTAYYARKSYIGKNPEIIEGFTRAIYRGLTFVHEHTPEEIAEVILRQFPDTSMNDLITIVKRYKDIDTWSKTPELIEESFEHLQNIMEEAGELTARAPYKELVNNEFAKKVSQ